MKIMICMFGVTTIISLIWGWGALGINHLNARQPDEGLLHLSEQLLYSVKTGEPTDSLQLAIGRYSVSDLAEGLSNDNARKAFWINIYNAYYQILAAHAQKAKPHIFTDKTIPFAGAIFSLDDVEHGILRRYRWKYSLGYLPQFLPSMSIKELAVSNIDFRIHFALNCGARSCPPIAFYDYDNIDAQLELATRSFLESETSVDEANKTVHVTKIMQWFKADFKGEKGIKQILSHYLGKDFTGYKIRFSEYNWNEELKKFKTEAPKD